MELCDSRKARNKCILATPGNNNNKFHEQLLLTSKARSAGFFSYMAFAGEIIRFVAPNCHNVRDCARNMRRKT
jgi:hypothetical protein